MQLRLSILVWTLALCAGCAASGRTGVPGSDAAPGPDGMAGLDGTVGVDGTAALDSTTAVDAAPTPDAGPNCGDGVVDTGEQCDDGNMSSNDSCLNTCVNNLCGDGHLWIGTEQCDDGNSASGDGCTGACVTEFCGDGVVQAGLGEQCEGGGQSQGCTTSCGSSGTQTCVGSSCTWSACAPPAETCDAVDEDCDGDIDTTSCLATVWRFYHPSTGDHMYKTSQSPDPGYVFENISFKVYTTQVAGTVPLYQRFNGTDHLPSYSATEADPWYYGTVTLGYVATSGSWGAAGFSSAELCRYYHSGIGDHMLFTYISNANLPTVLPGYAREGCGHWVWDFH